MTAPADETIEQREQGLVSESYQDYTIWMPCPHCLCRADWSGVVAAGVLHGRCSYCGAEGNVEMGEHGEPTSFR